jgi:hypothetical protein
VFTSQWHAIGREGELAAEQLATYSGAQITPKRVCTAKLSLRSRLVWRGWLS